jgi:hypothetical protein
VTSRQKDGERPIDIQVDMKVLMRKQSLPSNYYKKF